MKRIVFAGIASIVLLMGSGCQSTLTTQSNNLQGSETEYVEMVWIPRTGKRYHRNERCSGMKKPSNVTVQKAIDFGFSPCENCY